MKKVYYYATYQENDEKPISASIIEATSIAQIRRASMHLFEHYKKYETYKEAFNFVMLNASSLGYDIHHSDIKACDVTNY